MKTKLIVTTLACAIALGGAKLLIAAGPSDVGAALSPGQALLTDDSSKTVSVRGVLNNVGTNFFTDRRIVLADPDQRDRQQVLNVMPWVPLSVGLPPKSGGERPKVLSDYLDKEVILTGRIQVRLVKGLGATKILVVTDAQVVTQAQ